MVEQKSRAGWLELLARKRKPIVLVGSVLFLIGFIVFVYFGYHLQLDWTGFNESIGPNIRQYQPTKSLWDWLQLLIVPAVLGVAATWLNFVMNRNERAETKQRADIEHAIAQDSQRETLLQTYLDRMSDLILTNHLRQSGPDTIEARHIARVRTMTVLLRLDDDRKGSLIRFLYDAGLITIVKGTGESIINLDGANLSNANLNRTNLIGADLRGADLSGANLSFARFDDAHLEKATLSEANITGAFLTDAQLNGTKLGGARLRGTNLKRANLNDADLRETDLYRADISRADVSGANLSGLDLTDVIFDQITMSNETNLEGTKLTPEQIKILSKVNGGLLHR